MNAVSGNPSRPVSASELNSLLSSKKVSAPQWSFYLRESLREGLCNHRRTFVCLSVC